MSERTAERITPSDGFVYVGLMSGTSVDGISASVVRIRDEPGAAVDAVFPPVTHELIGCTVRAYNSVQRQQILDALNAGTPEAYCRLNFQLGEWLADAAVAAMAEAGVARADVRAIASHGQTVWHVPRVATWQTGESAVVAERTGIDVISDFRVRDVAAGGHGAPLVPVADALLYANRDAWRLLQNIGGMANVTVVPPGGDPHGVRAFDTGPGMALIDTLARACDPSLPYDVDGRLAAAGRVIEPVLAVLLADPYFAEEPPKSTGRERFGPAYANDVLARVRAAGGTSVDAVTTAVAFTARSIADAYARFVPEPVRDVVISGGGAKHPVLMAMLREAIARPDDRFGDGPSGREASCVVHAFDALFYDGEAKEAAAFALLAHLHLARRPGNLIGATGARGLRVLGKLTPA